jgi:MFS family permease
MIYPLLAVRNTDAGMWKMNIYIPLVMSFVVLALAVIAPYVYDDEKKAAAAADGKGSNEIEAEIQAAKDRMLVKPSAFAKFLAYFYAFLCMAIMYGAQQYTKAFGQAYSGLTEVQAAGMTTIYTLGSLCAVIFWAFMMAKLKWNPLKVIIVDSVMTAIALAVVLLIHNVAIVYAAILCIGFFSAGGALQTGLCVVQMFNPGPKGRNTGIYYTFMGAASYLIPVVAAKLTVISGEGAAVYTLMGMMLVLAILATLSTLYLISQHKKVFGESPL